MENKENMNFKKEDFQSLPSKPIAKICFFFTAQPHSTKSEFRFCAGSNPACSVSEICNETW